MGTQVNDDPPPAGCSLGTSNFRGKTDQIIHQVRGVNWLAAPVIACGANSRCRQLTLQLVD